MDAYNPATFVNGLIRDMQDRARASETSHDPDAKRAKQERLRDLKCRQERLERAIAEVRKALAIINDVSIDLAVELECAEEEV